MAMLFPDVDRSGFVWDIDKCTNNPWYNTQYSNSPEDANRRIQLNYLASRVTDGRFKKKIRTTKNRHMKGNGDRPSYYAIVAELVVHELLLLHGYNPEYEIGNGKRIDFLATSDDHAINIEVVHKESKRINIEKVKQSGFDLTIETSDTQVTAIKHCLEKKHSKHYELNGLPYIIAIDNQKDGCTLMSFLIALYGSLQSKGIIGKGSSSFDYEIYPSGWFYKHTDKCLFGILAITGIKLNHPSTSECCIFRNPFYNNELVEMKQADMFPLIKKCYPDEKNQIDIRINKASMPSVLGTKLSELITFPSLS